MSQALLGNSQAGQALLGAWQSIVGAGAGPENHGPYRGEHRQRSHHGGGFAPRAMLVDQREPDRADRVILPMSSGDTIIVGDTGQITSRPQDVAFRPERIIIGQGTTPDGAADWVVSDIKVGNKSQLSQSGEIPGDMFDPKAIDAYVSFATVQTAMDFVMVVALNNAGDSNAAQFYCAVLGLAAVGG